MVCFNDKKLYEKAKLLRGWGRSSSLFNESEEIDKRFNSFDEDITHWKDYDYVIINKNLEVCFKQIEEIIKTHKKKSNLSLV